MLRLLGTLHLFTPRHTILTYAVPIIGNGRLDAFCFDGVKRMCTIRGKLKNRVWINNVCLRITFDKLNQNSARISAHL